MFATFLDALLLETMFEVWLNAIHNQPTRLIANPNYREWTKGIFVSRLEMLLEQRS